LTWRRLGRIALALLALLLAYQLWLLGWIVYWKWNNPAMTSFMSEQQARLASQHPDDEFELKHQWVAYPAISPQLKRALVASEDAKFLQHEGFDWEGIQTAWEKNLAKGRIVAGGSTISQQLAKNLFLSSQRTPWRKAEEAVITVMLEAVMDKRRIFEIYLNVIEWGDGVSVFSIASFQQTVVSSASAGRSTSIEFLP
jgi:monofunctional biosynthetic peptidoglycan transglycosylase